MIFSSERRMVLVTWVDNSFALGWKENDEELPLTQCQSVGFLLKTDKTALHLAGIRNHSDGQNGGLHTIAKGCVLSMRRLR